jgi:membrane protease YdiL (CAAX protease family)
MEPQPQPPSIKQASVPWLDLALVMMVMTFVFLFVGALFDLTLGTAAALVLGEVLILLTPLIYLLYQRIDVRSYVKISLNPKYLLLGIGLGVVLLFFNEFISTVLTYIFGNSQAIADSNQLLTGLTATPTGYAAVVASLALAGICEEFTFRGFLQNTITRNLGKYKWGYVPAIVFSAFIFGLFHFDPQWVYTLAAFITGMVLGLIYHRYNYTTSATAHASMNLIVLALLLLGA